jgi:transmembrane sensor
MSVSRPQQIGPELSPEMRAEAAAWIARLHDERRGPKLETEFQEWIRASDEHRRAFNRMTHVWDQAGKIQLRARDEVSAISERRRSRFSPWAGLAAAVVLAVVTAVYYWGDNALTTGVGQQQVRVLQDGTRVTLNTNTRIEVNYDKRLRRVRLVHGEAWFEVSKHPTWPFLVSAGDQEIRALGTSFVVRQDARDLSVTLMDGRISITPILSNDEALSQTPRILAPGDRLVVAPHQQPAVDRPELTRLTAWERGRVEFEDTPLADASTEMNRYNTMHVMVPDAEVAKLRVGGVFRAGDSDEFVKIVTAAFGLRADRNGSDIVLSRPAVQPAPSHGQ